MNITIIGPGAIGVLLAHTLANEENKISILVKPEHENLIDQRKIRIKDMTGKIIDKKIKIITRLSKTDLVILAVKSYDIENLLNQIKEINTPILCCQNGLQTLNILKNKIKPNLLSYLVTGTGCVKIEPGFSHYKGTGFTFLGQINGENGTVIKNISNTLGVKGIYCEVVKNIQDYIWLKAIINSAINPIATINKVRNGELKNKKLIALVKNICRESTNIAQKIGIKLPLNPWKEIVTIINKTAKNKCSMLQDIENQQKTEIDAINGEFVRIAKANNLDAKNNKLAILKIKKLIDT